MAEAEGNKICPVTPDLKSGPERKITRFDGYGSWEGREFNELGRLAESLDIAGKADICSIPDMWARPLVFNSALIDSNHLLHKQIVGEWRGLLALLALKEIRQFPVTATRFVLENESNKFTSALKKLLPSESIDENTAWTTCFIFLFNNHPIGATSPLSLVYTSADCYSRINNVAWFDGKKLFDPCSKLSRDEKRATAKWVSNLIAEVPTREAFNLNRITTELKDFQDALQVDDYQQLRLSSHNLGMDYGIYKYLNRPVAAEEKDPKKSHVILQGSIQNPKTKILIIDKEIASQWGMAEQDVNVYKDMTLASIPFSGPGLSHDQIGSASLDMPYEQRSSQEFFTQKLFVVLQKKAFTDNVSASKEITIRGKEATPILPFTEDILNYLSADDVANAVRIETSGDKVVVSLTLTLSGPNGTGKPYTARKEYSTNDFIEKANLPSLAIWPNFKSDDWHNYFTYYDTDAKSASFYAKPFGKSQDLSSSHNWTLQGREYIEICKLDVFPSVFVCEAEVAQPEGNKTTNVPAGIMIVTPLHSCNQNFNNKKIVFGIDFGTTNTSVYKRSGDKVPEAVTFKDRLLRVTNMDSGRLVWVEKNFIAYNDTQVPFLTVYRRNQKPQDKPFISGNIYNFSEYKDFSAGEDEIRTGLKWSVEPSERKYICVYLMQLAMQCAAEAAAESAKAEYSFTYPAAFNGEQIAFFKSAWRSAAGLGADGVGQCKEVLESIAAAHYFASDLPVSDRALFESGAVCIDIGGGTSDISLYQGRSLKWHSSLLYAGRTLFLDVFHGKPSILEVFKDEIESVASEITKLNKLHGNRNSFYGQLDALINKYGESLLKQLKNYTGRDDIKGFIDIITVGLSGLMYYIGLSLKSLAEGNVIEKRMPNVYICGKGSQIFHWSAGGNYKNDPSPNTLFQELLIEAAGFEAKDSLLKIIISPKPKTEAAYGVLCDAMLNPESDLKAKQVCISGEPYSVGKSIFEWDKALLSQQLRDGIKIESLPNLTNFINAFNTVRETKKLTFSPLQVTAQDKNHILQRVRDITSGFEAVDINEIHVEPLFITTLKCLLELKIEQWVKES